MFFIDKFFPKNNDLEQDVNFIEDKEDRIDVMYKSILNNNIAECKKILDSGMDPNTEIYGYSLLSLCVEHNRVDLASFIITLGIDYLKLLVCIPQNPIYLCVKYNRLSILRIILERYDIDINEIKIQNKKLLFYSIEANNCDMTTILLKYNCNVDDEIWLDLKPLDIAIKNDNDKIIHILINNDVKINQKQYTKLYNLNKLNIINAIFEKYLDDCSECFLCNEVNNTKDSVVLFCHCTCHKSCMDRYIKYNDKNTIECNDCIKARKKRKREKLNEESEDLIDEHENKKIKV